MPLRDLTPWRGQRNLDARERTGSPLSSLHQEMDRLFDDFFGNWGMAPFRGLEAGTFVPRVELKENDKEIQITAELPGVDEKDIRISATDDVLMIEGEKKSETEEKEKGYYRTERYFGSFHREIALPSEIDRDKSEANFKNGILRLTLPKTEKAQKTAKTIPIKKTS